MCTGAKSDAITDMTTIARAHRDFPALIFLAASPNHHRNNNPQANTDQEDVTDKLWGSATRIKDIWSGSVGGFIAPGGHNKHQYYNINALCTDAHRVHKRNALWITADGPTFARLSNLGLWEQSGRDEPADILQTGSSEHHGVFSTAMSLVGEKSGKQAIAWADTVRGVSDGERTSSNNCGAWALTLTDAQNSFLLLMHSTWKHEISAAVRQFEKEDLDGHQSIRVRCAFYGDTLILAAGRSSQDIYACSRICNIVTQIMARYEAPDEWPDTATSG